MSKGPYWFLTDGRCHALLVAPFASLVPVLGATGPCFPLLGVVSPASVLETGLCPDSALRSVRRAIK